jgi:uncharacterized protein
MEQMSLIMILSASLLGSLHCAGMCGGFAAFYAGGSQRVFWPHVAYNGGRLITYAALGAVSGLIGQSLDLAGSNVVGFQRVTAVLVGVLMIFWGVRAFIRKSDALFFDGSQSGFGKFLGRILAATLKKDSANSPSRKALVIGLLSTLLPCGFLYGFAALAAASGTPVKGMLVMAFFWAGTVPVMATMGGVIAALSSRLRSHVPRVIAILLILAGFFSLSKHVNASPGKHGHSATPSAEVGAKACH